MAPRDFVGKGSKLEALKQTDNSSQPCVDSRRKPRFKLEVEITIHSRTCGELKGQTVDISESGVSAMLRMEAPPIGETVELDFRLPLGPVTIYATVRQKNAFRYGFEFLETTPENGIIRSTCRDLAVEQSLSSLFLS